MSELNIYIDGSFKKSSSTECYSGLLALDSKGSIIKAIRFILRDKYTESWNVSGELMASSSAMLWVGSLVDVGALKPDAEVSIYYDYIGISKIFKGEWKNLKTGATTHYKNVCSVVKCKYPKLKFKFVKVKAHSGNKYNECVDSIAKGETAYIDGKQVEYNSHVLGGL